ncbi:MAG: SMI1/KNR4 family protein [Tannerellaceae bacterium]|nr:SMI1/KNR4 family protein [Tannerellaceae bacterium]
MKQIILNGINTTVNLERFDEYKPQEQDIHNFEKELGFKLPGDYREFLLNYNGGTCEFANIILPKESYLADLFGLFPKDYKTYTTKLRLPTDPELIELWEGLPTNILPIGEDDSGDMIAIKFDGENSAIEIYSHETNGFRIEGKSSTFTEFLSTTQRE